MSRLTKGKMTAIKFVKLQAIIPVSVSLLDTVAVSLTAEYPACLDLLSMSWTLHTGFLKLSMKMSAPI